MLDWPGLGLRAAWRFRSISSARRAAASPRSPRRARQNEPRALRRARRSRSHFSPSAAPTPIRPPDRRRDLVAPVRATWRSAARSPRGRASRRRRAGCCARTTDYRTSSRRRVSALTLDDVTCSGATIANVRDVVERRAAPQLDAVTADTALISFDGRRQRPRLHSTLAGSAAIRPQLRARATRLRSTRKVERLRADLSGADRRTSASAAPSAAIVLLVTYAKVANPPECAALGF